MPSPRRNAFTLIELLTVIAIIALLVAILFPVFSRAREAARQATCVTNMHELYVKSSLYHQDYEAYPPLLFGLPEQANGDLWVAGSPDPPVSAAAIRRGYLYPAYVKAVRTYQCPDNPIGSLTSTGVASFPSNSGWSGNATFGSHGIGGASPDTPIYFYLCDSYDLTAAPGGVSQGRSVAYARDWSAAQALHADTRQDAPNQLKYPSPPLDRTLLTWCNYHVSAGSTVCPAILASGTAKTIPAAEMNTKTWEVFSQP